VSKPVTWPSITELAPSESQGVFTCAELFADEKPDMSTFISPWPPEDWQNVFPLPLAPDDHLDDTEDRDDVFYDALCTELSVNPHERTLKRANKSYRVSNMSTRKPSSLCDRGANGGVAGSEMRVIATTDRLVNLTGIDNHEITDLKIVTAGAVAKTTEGPIIVIAHQYAHVPTSRSIHSPAQLEHYKNDVHDKSSKIGGLQLIKTLDGHILPMSIRNGLVCIDMHPFSDREWEELPHVILTSDEDWDPKVLDCEADDIFYDTVSDLDTNLKMRGFSETGRYTRRSVHANFVQFADRDLAGELVASATEVNEKEKDTTFFEEMRKFFLFRPVDVVKATRCVWTFDSADLQVTFSCCKCFSPQRDRCH
jgi:hypothetical protein